MGFSVKEIGFVLLLLIATGGVVRFCTPEKVVYETAEQEKKLDSLTTLTRSLKIDRSQLRDSLENTSQAFQEYVEENEEDLVAYNRIIGQLELTVDSLQEANMVSLGSLANLPSDSSGQQFQDTTLQRRSTFGNGLMEAVARGGIRNDSLFLDPPLISQLRPVRIDQAQFVSDDGSEVRAVTTSRDFEELKVVSVTTVEEEGKRFPWTELAALGGFILGYAL